MRQATLSPRSRSSAISNDMSSAPSTEASLELYLQRLEEQLDQVRQQVRQAQQFASLGVAAALIAHETRNLLQPQIAYAQYALRTEDPEITHKALELTIRNGELLGRISERALEMARGGDPQPSEANVREAAANAYEVLEYECHKKDVSFALDVPEDVVAWIDPSCLQQVLFNLILNAYQELVKCRGGKLRVEARTEAGWTTIKVVDSGPGIPEEMLDHMFEPMVSTKTSTANGQTRCGGIGLTVCRSFVEEVGGSVSVTSSPERGTAFVIRLPAGCSAATNL
jgi:signal transduction histidine kinase